MARKNFFTPPEAAKLLEVSDKTIYRWIAAGKLEAIEMPGDGPHGTRYRIRRGELRRLGVDLDSNGTGEE